MNILGYPIEIWAASIVAVLIKLQTSSTLTMLGALTTTIVALFSGVFLHETVAEMFGLDQSWYTVVAIVIALSAENLMKSIVELSADKEWLKDFIRFFVDREKVIRIKEDEKQ